MDHVGIHVRQVSVDRQVRVVLKQGRLVRLPRRRERLVCILLGVDLATGHLFGLKAFLVWPPARRLPALALSDDVFLGLFEFSAVHVLGCVARPVNRSIINFQLTRYSPLDRRSVICGPQ